MLETGVIDCHALARAGTNIICDHAIATGHARIHNAVRIREKASGQPQVPHSRHGLHRIADVGELDQLLSPASDDHYALLDTASQTTWAVPSTAQAVILCSTLLVDAAPWLTKWRYDFQVEAVLHIHATLRHADAAIRQHGHACRKPQVSRSRAQPTE
eukprot:7123588-Prymnesium_polylepis.1